MTWLFALLAAAATAPGAEPLAAPTLDELRARPEAYAGRRVRLHGQVDACFGFSCSLCPEDSTPENPQWPRCLRLGFDWFRTRGARGADMAPMFRYADVVLTARFDPTCWSRQVICTDNATVLVDARVEAVTRRRRSNQGLFRRQERLLYPPAAEAAALIAKGRRASDPQRYLAAFALPGDPQMKERGILCASASPRGGAVMPWSWEAAILARGSEDLYRCWAAKKVDGQWVIELD